MDTNANAIENRVFYPSEEVVKNANATPELYEEAKKDRLGFWDRMAKELVTWFEPYDKVLDDSNPPFYKWFTNGKLNVSYNCVDRHAKSEKRNKAAICYESEIGKKVVLTYGQLYREVNMFASALSKLGVKKGDRVCLYMPMIPEAAIAMLACTRIGAPHSIVFGGFSSDSLRDRINDAKAKILITADGNFRKGAPFPLKKNADEALKETPTVEKVVVVQNAGNEIEMVEGRDVWYHEIMATADTYYEPEKMDAEDMLFILYTSGSTGKPKGVVHTTGGYLVQTQATVKYVFDLKETDVYWCTADIGWITGHSYVVYGPLALGMTTFMYDGTIDYPDKDRMWDMAERWGVNVFYTAPTAIRTFMKWGTEYPKKHDLSQLRLLGTVGEPINPEAWMWYYENIGGGRCPIMDTWWQTETGAHMVTPLPITPLKPGTATIPFPGIEVDIVDENKQPSDRGYLVVKSPWPSMLRTIYGDDQRYIDQYWKRFGDYYFAGDGAKRDEMGYIWVTGRVDDVLNVSGHRLGTAEIESALVECEEVAEAAVIGKKHDVKGESVCAFVTLKDGFEGTPELVEKLRKHVGVKIGPIARPDDIIFTAALPKTRSGKIMRRLLRDIAEGRALGDITTLADPGAMQEIAAKYAGKED
ncbi:acetate/CoA ligase [Thermincola ferriacetica]|uniref:Acetyl-coenzyme A synthetase n=1 Tax=Thermincola ferriacetica TaxID=281456 RepID=A0A0L6W212_9FIRM|nr:acetate--CoA ligase [Thermincola ferriacetica]KNZ69408.1 acetate/CoA ligase [Thermincola ferriacetica]